MSSPYVIVLSALDEAVLIARAHSYRGPHRDVVRARIVLGAAAGRSNTVIAAQVGVGVDTVRKWRKRFSAHGVKGLADLPRPGRPRRFTEEGVNSGRLPRGGVAAHQRIGSHGLSHRAAASKNRSSSSIAW
jgi:hypothetical protein